jgi:hypothetical protein
MGIETFRNNPAARSVSRFLECAIHTASVTPKYIICDKGQASWYSCPSRDALTLSVDREALAIAVLSRFLPLSFSVVKTFKYVLNNVF